MQCGASDCPPSVIEGPYASRFPAVSIFRSDMELTRGYLVSRTIFASVRRTPGRTATHSSFHGSQRLTCVVQGEVLSLGHDTQNETPVSPPPEKGASKARESVKDRQMGSALRSVYQKTVDEAVPDEFLALLGKLD